MNGKVAHLVIDDRNLHKQIAFKNHDAGLHMTLQQTIFQHTECL